MRLSNARLKVQPIRPEAPGRSLSPYERKQVLEALARPTPARERTPAQRQRDLSDRMDMIEERLAVFLARAERILARLEGL